LGLQPDTVSDLPLRLATSSRIPPYHILRAVHKLSEPLLYFKIMLSVAFSNSEESHINYTWISGVSIPDKSVFQSGSVQVCLCTRCDVGTLWPWQFRSWKCKTYKFHTISVTFVEILLPNCQFENVLSFTLL
jgi:hypothetical protein